MTNRIIMIVGITCLAAQSGSMQSRDGTVARDRGSRMEKCSPSPVVMGGLSTLPLREPPLAALHMGDGGTEMGRARCGGGGGGPPPLNAIPRGHTPSRRMIPFAAALTVRESLLHSSHTMPSQLCC